MSAVAKVEWKQSPPTRIRPSLYRRGNKIYARVWIGGKRTFRSTGTNTPSVAERILRQFRDQEALRQNGIEPLRPALERKRTTNKLVAEYVAAGYPTSKMLPKEATTADTERKCFTRLLAYFGSSDASKISPADCDKYHQWRITGGFVYERKGEKLGKKVGNKVVDNELQALSNVLDYAVRCGHIRTNPIKRRPRYHREADTRHCREVAPTPPQLRLIENRFRANGLVVMANLVRFLAFTGLRINEALPLSWDKVDWANRRIHVRRLKKGIHPCVPMGKELLALLKNMKSESASRYLFPSPLDGERPIAYSSVYHQLRELCLSSQMKYVTLHGLRSFFVTQARQSGLTDEEIAALIGDKTGARIIAQTYGDFMPDYLSRKAKQIRFLAS